MSFMGFIYKYDLCVCVCERESGVLWDCVHVSKTGIPKQSAFFFFLSVKLLFLIGTDPLFFVMFVFPMLCEIAWNLITILLLMYASVGQ